jgi:hypothetical protein
MKVLWLVLSAALLLTTPVVAVEYHGRNLDGKKLPAKAYNYSTGEEYKVQISFDTNRATIYFNDDSKTTIWLGQRVISNPKDIKGFERSGHFPVDETFSLGLYPDTGLASNERPPISTPIETFWKISLESI